MTESRKQWLTWGEDSQAELFKTWTSSSVRGRIKIQSRGSKASQSISLIEQLQHPFRVRNFGDKSISNCGCHSNQSFPYTYYNRENVNLVYRKRTDFGAWCVQLLISTAEPPGKHRYGSWNNKWFIVRCHYRSFLRQTCRKLGLIKITSTCLWNQTRR